MSSLAGPFSKILTANSTAASFTALAATATKPSGTGVFDNTGGAAPNVPDSLLAMFLGKGADNATLSARLTGWRLMSDIWVPATLVELDLTLSAAVGVSGLSVANDERLADTIALVSAYSGLSGLAVRITSPTDDTPAHVVIDRAGWPIVQWTFKKGTATHMNGLMADL